MNYPCQTHRDELSQLMSQILQDHFHRAKQLAWFQTTHPWCMSNLNWSFDSVCLLSLKAETLAYDSVCSTTSRCSIFQGRGYWELLNPRLFSLNPWIMINSGYNHYIMFQMDPIWKQCNLPKITKPLTLKVP